MQNDVSKNDRHPLRSHPTTSAQGLIMLSDGSQETIVGCRVPRGCIKFVDAKEFGISL
jgi:hypothetical protein